MANILVVDDEQGIRELLFDILNDEGHTVTLAENAAQARAKRESAAPDLVLLDIWMPDTDGVSLLKEWVALGPLKMSVIMMSGHATIETAVAATQLGALSFLEKPVTLQKLLAAVELGLEHAQKLAAKHMVYGGGKKPLTGLSAAPVVATSSSSSISTPTPVASSADTDKKTDELLGAPLLKPDYLIRLDQPLRDAKDQFDHAYFSYHLQAERGAVAKVAEKTGLERTHLYRKLKLLGFDPKGK